VSCVSVASISLQIELEQVVVQRRLVSNLWEVITIIRYSGDIARALDEAARVVERRDWSREVEVVLPLQSFRTRWVEVPGVLSSDELWLLAADVFGIDCSDTQVDTIATKCDAALLSVASIGELRSLQAALSRVGLRSTRFLGLIDREIASRDAVFYASVAGCLPRPVMSSWPALRTIETQNVEYIDLCMNDGEVAGSVGEVSPSTNENVEMSLGHADVWTDSCKEINTEFAPDSSGPAEVEDKIKPVSIRLSSETSFASGVPLVGATDSENEHTGSLLGQSLIVCSPFGGSGKSLVGQLLRIILKRKHTSFHHVVADKVGPHGRSVTGLLFPDVLELGVGAKALARLGHSDENSQLKFWDRLGEVLRRGDALVEIGTNVTPDILAWADKRQAGHILEKLSKQRQTLIVTFPGSLRSSAEVRNFVDPFLDKASWRVNRIVLCANDHMSVAEGFALDFVESLSFGDAEVVTLRLPHCNSPLLYKLHSLGMPLPSIPRLSFCESVDFPDMGTWETIGAAHDLYDWLDLVLANIEQIVFKN
jgi:hypothetical protein